MILNLQGVPTDGEFEDNLLLCVLQETTRQNRYTPLLEDKSNYSNFPKFSFYDFPPASKVPSLQYIINILLTVSTGNLV